MSEPAAWKTLTEQGDERTESLRVPGGWLYRTRVFVWRQHPMTGYMSAEEACVALAFQPERAE